MGCFSPVGPISVVTAQSREVRSDSTAQVGNNRGTRTGYRCIGGRPIAPRGGTRPGHEVRSGNGAAATRPGRLPHPPSPETQPSLHFPSVSFPRLLLVGEAPDAPGVPPARTRCSTRTRRLSGPQWLVQERGLATVPCLPSLPHPRHGLVDLRSRACHAALSPCTRLTRYPDSSPVPPSLPHSSRSARSERC